MVSVSIHITLLLVKDKWVHRQTLRRFFEVKRILVALSRVDLLG